MFEANRKAEQALGRARRGTLYRRAMFNEALGAAKTGGAGEETKTSGYRERLRPASRHNEREHATGRCHLSRGKLVAGVASKSRIVDALHQWASVPSLELVGSRVMTTRTTRPTVCCVELTTR
jgi:hypothetical protein